MVKSAAQRTAKAQAKIDPTVIGQRITAMQTIMNDNAATAQSDGYTVANTVRGILNQYSVTGNFANTFHAFALELASKARKYSGNALTVESNAVLAKWKARCTINSTIPADFAGILKLICTSYGVTYA